MSLYIVFGEELSNLEAYKLCSICTRLVIPYYSEYVGGTARQKQNVAIGPLTKGDIDDVIDPKSKMTVWRLQNEY